MITKKDGNYRKKEALWNCFQSQVELVCYRYVLREAGFAFERLEKLFWSYHLSLSPLLPGYLQTCIFSNETFAGERMTKFIDEVCFTAIENGVMLHMIFSYPHCNIKELILTF